MKPGRIVFLFSIMAVFASFAGRPGCQTAGADASLDTKAAVLAKSIKPLGKELSFFPIVTQFSPVPSGKGWRVEKEALDDKKLRDTIDNYLAHGFTGIETGVNRPDTEKAFILNYAQSKGMILTHHAGALELFGRDKPPVPSVYSPEYPVKVRANAEKALSSLKNYPRLYNVFPYQDEPFHWGPASFDYGPDEKRVFRERYGYDLPPDLDSIKGDPVKWLDVINFRSDNFPAGWRTTFKTIKDINPDFVVTLTHDSHNTFGAGYGSHSELAIDDVYHWGGDFTDMFVYDIYPYMSIDFRFGAPSVLPLPRMSQFHYTFAQMRNLAYSHKKKLGFWVETYNPAWFKGFINEDLRKKDWIEQEMTMSAIAAGSDYILTGYHVPIDSLHWETFGRGNRLIQKTGGDILKTRRVRANACMLFPRTHYIQMQEEYYDVGLSYELFLRAFGELDIIHEEQVTDDTLNGYRVLVLFDVKLLPEKVARRIASFVEKGGTVIADCVPSMDEYKRPMPVMNDLFGVRDAATGRITRTGHWIGFPNEPQRWDFRGPDAPDESVSTTDGLKTTVLGQPLDITLVSPRPCTVTTGEVLARTSGGKPAVVRRPVGGGKAFLLGFCVQDTYFKMFQDGDARVRDDLRGLFASLARESGVRSHVWSSNPDIEASVRTGENGGFLFVINHEAKTDDTTVRLADLGFTIGSITDVATGKKADFTVKDGVAELRVTAPKDRARLFRITGN